MGKTPRKARQHSFQERFGKAKEPRIVRTMHEPIHVGLSWPDQTRPRCFWREGQAYPIYRVVKRWRDEYQNRWYRVKTDEGTFDLYEHRRWISRAENRYRSYWYLAAEIEMVPVRRAVNAEDGDPAKAPAVSPASPSRGERDGRTRTGRGGSSSRRSRTPDSPARMP